MDRVNVTQEWGIYHSDREYAREMGDPELGTVYAETKEQAEALGRRLYGHRAPTGVWAWPRSLRSRQDLG